MRLLEPDQIYHVYTQGMVAERGLTNINSPYVKKSFKTLSRIAK